MKRLEGLLLTFPLSQLHLLHLVLSHYLNCHPPPPSNSGDLDERNQDQTDYSELGTRSVAGPSWFNANWTKKTQSDWYEAVAVSFFNFSDVLKANQAGEKDNIAGNCKKCGKLVKGQRGTTTNWKTHAR